MIHQRLIPIARNKKALRIQSHFEFPFSFSFSFRRISKICGNFATTTIPTYAGTVASRTTTTTTAGPSTHRSLQLGLELGLRLRLSSCLNTPIPKPPLKLPVTSISIRHFSRSSVGGLQREIERESGSSSISTIGGLSGKHFDIMSPTADIATTTTAAGPEVTAIQQNDVEVGAGNLEKRIGDIEITPKKEAYVPRYIDVAINLADEVYSGVYHGRKVHEDDHADVVQRALDVGCLKMMITGSDLESSRRAIALAEKFPGILYATVGVHPCQALHFEDKKHGSPEDHLNELEKLVVEGKKKGVVMAFGEIGLDYDRLNHCPAPSQLTHFASQLLLARRLNLPLFLHSRAAATDFENLLIPHIPHLPGCLVHSFTGTLAEMQRLVDLGLYIGINGCSLKTLENLDVVRQVPLDRIMLETDGPWCEIRKSSAGYGYLLEKEEDEGSGVNGNGNNPPPVQRGEGKPRKKDRWLKGYMVSGRNEPVTIEQVAWIVARVKGVSLEVLCEAAWKNTVKVFGLGEKKVE